MRVVHAEGVEGARTARGVAIVIDVLRAFTVTATALAAGALECRLVETVDEALALQRRIPGAVVSAEVEGLPISGIPISNSPTQVAAADLGGRTLIQRSSDGTQGAVAAAGAAAVLAASLVVAAATARRVILSGAPLVTLVAMGAARGHTEDRVCADYLEALLEGRPPPDLALLLDPLRRSRRFRTISAGAVPGFPATDLDLALRLDSFDFAMPVTRDELGLKATRG